MENYTTMGNLMKAAQIKMKCQERTIKFFYENQNSLKQEWMNMKKENKSFSKCPFEAFILFCLVNSKKMNKIESNYLNDILGFYSENYKFVDKQFKKHNDGCKSLFEYIFTAYDKNKSENYSISLSNIFKS